MPDGRDFSISVIHLQKRKEGFFKYPVLVVGVKQHFVYFSALTKSSLVAIRDMKMSPCMGSTTADEGHSVLRLTTSLICMQNETWMDLRQSFCIEYKNLKDSAVDVSVDAPIICSIFIARYLSCSLYMY
jgi:hypothetical protein